MREFLKDYVKMIAQTYTPDLEDNKLANIVDSLMQNEELWDTFDSYIYELLDEDDE